MSGAIATRIISIHALVKRATIFLCRPYRKSPISIHALVKRATACACNNGFFAVHFNPRPREEGDEDLLRFKKGASDFNPRPREEGDFVHL